MSAPDLAQVVSALKKVDSTILQLICCFLDPTRMILGQDEQAGGVNPGSPDSPRQTTALQQDLLQQLFNPLSNSEGKAVYVWGEV